jgi:hypothetical protein
MRILFFGDIVGRNGRQVVNDISANSSISIGLILSLPTAKTPLTAKFNREALS